MRGVQRKQRGQITHQERAALLLLCAWDVGHRVEDLDTGVLADVDCRGIVGAVGVFNQLLLLPGRRDTYTVANAA